MTINRKRLADTFDALVRIDSESKDEAAVCEFIAGLFSNLGAEIITDKSQKETGSNTETFSTRMSIMHNGSTFYVEAATGVVTAKSIDASVTTLSTHIAYSDLDLEDQMHVRAALGWRLPYGKGDFRIRFDGYKEDGYTFSSNGVQASLDQSLNVANSVLDNLNWWTIDVTDGDMHAVRTPPVSW